MPACDDDDGGGGDDDDDGLVMEVILVKEVISCDVSPVAMLFITMYL